MDTVKLVHSTPVPLLDTTTLIMPISVGYLSPMEIKDNASTSGAMQQLIVTLETICGTAHVHFMSVEQPRHLLAVIFTVSQGLTEHHPDSGTPLTHSGMAKVATVVASAAIPVVHHGSSRPCLQRLRLTLKFAGVSHLGLPMTELALSNLKFTYGNCITAAASAYSAQLSVCTCFNYCRFCSSNHTLACCSHSNP